MQYLSEFANLLIPLLLLLAGYGAGRLAERRHYKSILRREDELGDLIVVVSKTLPASMAASDTRLVMGNVVISVDYFKRFVAQLRMVFGGRVHTYESLLDRGRREALLRMQKQAKALGATAIFNTRFETVRFPKAPRTA